MVEKVPSPTVSLDLVRMFGRYIGKKGLVLDEIGDWLEMGSAAPAKPEDRISARRFETLWNAAAERSGDPDFGLHVGEAMAGTYAGGHVLFMVMKNCPSVGAAMGKFFRYHCILADTVQPVSTPCGDRVHISWDTASGLQVSRQSSEALLSMFAGILGHMTEGHTAIASVRFAHPRPDDTREHERIFNAPLLFDRKASALVVRSSAMDIPIFMADAQLLDNLETFVSRRRHRFHSADTWTQRVDLLLEEMILGGETGSVKAVAGRLALSVRTLQNRLSEEQTTYQEILDGARQRIAKEALARGEASVCDIAFLLGFSEQSAFNHAFKRWTGETPLAYMRKKGAVKDA